jgi:hypothetical protein
MRDAYLGGASSLIMQRLLQGVMTPAVTAGGATLSRLLNVNALLTKESLYGAIYSAAIAGPHALSVIKMPKKVEDNKMLKDEGEVQSLLNLLRALVPNFAMLYGTFECPQLPMEGNVFTICMNEGPQVNYLVMERVRFAGLGPALSLHGLMKAPRLPMMADAGTRLRSCLSILSQLLLALQVAQTAFEFTHYDLHDDNILLRPMYQQEGYPNAKFAIDYPVPDEFFRLLMTLLPAPTQQQSRFDLLMGYSKLTIRTLMIPVMIDFGHSRTRLATTNPSNIANGITNKFSSLYDAYMIVSQMN